MNELPHIPALRRGKIYRSLDQAEIVDCRTQTPRATISQINSGVIRKDLAKLGDPRRAFQGLSSAQLIEICAKAGDLFLNGALPVGDQGQAHSADDYVEALAATSGLPHILIRRNMMKIHFALTHMRGILNSLTRGLDLAILEKGLGEQNGVRLSFYPTTASLGLVMPSNSPAVNSLWLAAVPLRVPVILKPGREEPWTPYRLIQAFIQAGCPAEAFGFYPTDHEGAAEILRRCGRALVFGDKTTAAQHANNPAIQVHGPGYSKILIGDDQIDRWAEFLEMMAASVSENGGRSCVNASAIVAPKHSQTIAEALAQKLAPIEPALPEDESAKLSAFASPKMAESIDQAIEKGLKTPGAIEMTARFRHGPRLSRFNGGVYLRPTIVWCDSFNHPLANREFLFPYASVVPAAQSEMLQLIGPSLVVSAITRDPAFRQQLVDSPLIERLNLGAVPTTKISWDQPHEGNLFEFLYRRRSIEIAPD